MPFMGKRSIDVTRSQKICSIQVEDKFKAEKAGDKTVLRRQHGDQGGRHRLVKIHKLR